MDGVVGPDDTETARREDESVVTMMDVLKEQEEFEEDANAVLGASDDKNCTYSMGYIKRQAIYACMTCNSDAKDDPAQRAGICLACSLKCHEDHELVELYTKRNFRCDCGNPKFKSHPCQFTPNKPELNEENNYNQNFSGLYCICQRPYPDPDVTEEDEMIQCIICEDWLHSAHLNATVPDNDQYAEMICKQCMEKNSFLHNYADLIVNSEVDVDICLNGISCNDINESNNVTDLKNDKPKKRTENVNKNSPIQNNETSLEQLDNDTNRNVEIDKDLLPEALDTSGANDSTSAAQDNSQTVLENNVMNVDTELEVISKNDLLIENTSTVELEQLDERMEDSNDMQNENIIDTKGGSDEPSIVPLNEDSVEKEESKENKDNNEPDNTKNSISIANSIQSTRGNENNSLESNVMECDPGIEKSPDNASDEVSNLPLQHVKEDLQIKDNCDTIKAVDNKELFEVTQDREEGEHPAEACTKSLDELEEERLLEEPEEPKSIIEYTIPQADNASNGTNVDVKTEAPLKENNIDNAQFVNSDENISPTELPLHSPDKKDSMCSENMDITNATETAIIQDCMEENGKLDIKRKLSVENQVQSKKPKLDLKPCTKPQHVKHKYKGATFWPAHFRQKLCTCNDCLSMYKDLAVLFLLDPEDTVSAYEYLGKEKTNGKPASEYEKGLAALSSLDRVQQINALTEYNKMRDKLLDFLKSFKERKEVVKEEDIKAFFAGMKPKREPDGVYFCR